MTVPTEHDVRPVLRGVAGRLEFTLSPEQAFEIPGQKRYFGAWQEGHRLLQFRRTADMFLEYCHTCPGTGTRHSRVPLAAFQRAKLLINLTWNPDEIALYVGDGRRVLAGSSQRAPFAMVIAKNGWISEVPATHDTLDVQADGVRLIAPTAINGWKHHLHAARHVAHRNPVPDDFFGNAVVCNLLLSMMVTSFEVYLKKRFLELELEGHKADNAKLLNKFASGFEADVIAKAADAGRSIAAELVSRRAINFQEYAKANMAFARGFGLRFSELGFASKDIDRIKEYIKWRHRFTHGEPTAALLRFDKRNPATPVFSGIDLALTAMTNFDAFVQRLHDASLRLGMSSATKPSEATDTHADGDSA